MTWLVAFRLALPLVGLVLVLLLAWRTRAMKKRQNELVVGLEGRRYWRVNLARQPFFRRWLRIMPFEAKGVLIDDGGQLRLTGFWLKDSKAFAVTLDKSRCQVQWLGNQGLRTGNLYWAKLSTARGSLLFCADTGLYALPSREALADIFRSVFPQFPLDASKTTDFALEKNPRTLMAVGVLAALALFALLDSFFFNPYQLVEAQLTQILCDIRVQAAILCGAALMVALFYRWLAGGRVPMRESLVLSLILSMALLGAAVPMAKRVDQALAAQPTQMYAYRVTASGYLEPVDATLGLPRLEFRRLQEYWAHLPKGAEYQIPLLRGPLGLWQLDHRVLDPPIRAFYERR